MVEPSRNSLIVERIISAKLFFFVVHSNMPVKMIYLFIITSYILHIYFVFKQGVEVDDLMTTNTHNLEYWVLPPPPLYVYLMF